MRAIRRLAVVTTLLAACGGGGEAGEQAGAEGTPADGDMLVVGITSDLDTMFPPVSNSRGASDVYGNIYWYLMRSEADFINFRPGLADSFTFSEDSLQVTFHIHPGITWHDGAPFSAHDVVFAIGVCKAPEINFSSVSWLDHITNVEAVDSLTVRFTYDERYMYQVVDANVCYPLPEHILGDVPLGEMANHPIARAPVGTGPFRFVSWDAGQEVVLEANTDFALGRPHLNRITFRIVPDATNLATQIQNGDVDLWPQFTPPSFYPQFNSDPELVVRSYPGRSYTYLAWNTQDPLFQDKRVRQALTLATNRQEIVDALIYGQGQVGTQPLISTIWAHDPSIQPYPFDPDSAMALLEAAGWTDADGDGVREKDGQRLAFSMKTNNDNRLRVDIATVLQQQLRAIGADVRPEPLEFNQFIEEILDKDFQAAVGGWSVGIKAELQPTFGQGELFNFVSAENPELQRLIVEAELTRDMEAARALWSRAQRIIVDEAYYSFLFQLNDLHAIDSRFQNVDMNAYGWSFNLEEWYVPEGRQKFDVPVGAAPVAGAGADTAAPGAGR
ncbi:MAG TPA: ABC transporter substrate-binding protein [Gemmatimonadota bacterium]|nr:ABC transporter substrate-binding protein [Gemmatimonadota bacterium]